MNALSLFMFLYMVFRNTSKLETLKGSVPFFPQILSNHAISNEDGKYIIYG
jgi:hypothetical protein